MIQFPAKHLFEARVPILEEGEEEMFYQHPLHNFKCNQLGALFIEDERYQLCYSTGGTYIRTKRRVDGVWRFMDNIGQKQRLVWECYEGRLLESGKQFLFVNGNPLDFSYGNLVLTTSKKDDFMVEVLNRKKRFVWESIEHLKKLEVKYEKKGVEKQDLYDLLMLPIWLKAARKKLNPLPPELPLPSRRKTTYTRKTPPITPADEQRIIRYFDEGWSYVQIRDRMGFGSKSPVKRICHKWGRSRKK